MAARSKKGMKGSIDDVLGDLLGDNDPSPSKPYKASPLTSDPLRRPRGTVLSGKKSLLDDTFFSQLAKEAAAEESDVSEADPQILLDRMKDMDDMDAEIFGGKKPKSAPAKDSGMSRSAEVEPKPEEKTAGAKRGHSAPESEQKPPPGPAGPTRPFKRFSFDDVEDPLAGLLSDEDEAVAKKTPSPGTKAPQEPSPVRATAAPLPAPVRPSPAARRKDDLTFEEDTDDLMDALGFGDSPEGPQKEEGAAPRPARSKLDELLGRGTSPKLLERPQTGERKEFKLDPKYQKQPEKEDTWGDEDFAFGSYQPTLESSPEGRNSRRMSVRFSAEGNDNLKSDTRSHPSTPVTRSPVRAERSRADWLGLKDDDLPDLTPPAPVRGSPRVSAVTPSPASQPPSGTKPGDGTGTQPRTSQSEPVTGKQEDDGWLASALTRKRTQKQEKGAEERVRSETGQGETPGTRSSAPVTSQQLDITRTVRETTPATAEVSGAPVTSQQLDITRIVRETTPATAEVSWSPLPWEGPRKVVVPPAAGAPISRREENPPTAPASHPPEPHRAAVQPARSAERRPREDGSDSHADLLPAQNRVLELEAQVRKLQLEREQQNLLLETLRQRQSEDLEVIESAHRSRLKLVEDSARQREELLRLETRELSAQYLSRGQAAEREKAELLAQYQRRLTEFQREKEAEVERIRELQRASVQEMCEDHGKQLERLKQLKDQEIDAVTSASSHTRSLNGVIEQMESFSHKLGDLSQRVENTQHSTSQEREMGARQREGQLRALQERLSRQQRDMEEERISLRAVITNMETRLSEQSRLLEQERWRVSSEQTKMESLQRSLEEQRRVMTQQLAMEREELERAKSALLEEQQAVMRRCAEERSKMAAEWSEFQTQQKLSNERAERDVSRAMKVETQREGTIINLAKEQAELKVRGSELRGREELLASARETLERERQELRLEKERVNALALRVRHRAEEIESMSKLASQRYEEGEKALVEAQRVESEHHGRLRAIQQKLETLRHQEEQMHQERLNLSQQRRQLTQLRQGLPTDPALFPAGPRELPLTSQSFPHAPADGPGGQQDALRASGFHAKLALMKFSAERDRDFLEDEEIFLETLKKSSHLSSSQAV